MSKRIRDSVVPLAALAFVLFAVQAYASDHAGELTAEFHQTYPLAADGRVSLSNINGAAHIVGWDRNEVKVDAIKYAHRQERLDEAKIIIDASSNRVSIRTQYPEHDNNWNWGSHDNPASVEYTITVPRNARLDKIELINGGLDIKGVSGEVQASCINGTLVASELGGRAELSTINGTLKAQLERLSASPVELSSVNGSVSLTLPSDAQAELEASTVHGGISNDFGLNVDRHQWVGRDLHGKLGDGRTHIKLSNVNGAIHIEHANDGRTLSPVKNLIQEGDDDKI
ncbi:MAG TPA: DUF4097 family beta strand repeat-containing protein [Terriglobales bacterium]|nr:DUF4097 family beta strand repeat-containing protein [Terriglobales bacterium]